jgi:hypothetical protein
MSDLIYFLIIAAFIGAGLYGCVLAVTEKDREGKR